MVRHDRNSGDALTPRYGLGNRRTVRRKRNGGQALVELAAVVPFAFFLIVLVMNFGGLINAWISVANAARTAADYAILSGSSAGLPTTATSTTLQNLINADMGTLPNISAGTNPQICIRQKKNVTPDANSVYTNIVGACSFTMPADGDVINASTSYYSIAVDITYTYTPFFVSSRFINYALPNIPTSVHQRVIMRVL